MERTAQQPRENAITGTASLWFVVLAGPLAWATMLVVDYALEEVIACTPGAAFSGAIWGLGVRPFILAINGALIAIVLAALVTSVVRFRRLGRGDGSTGGVARWMALAGIINSVIFGIGVAAGFLPPLLLRACEVTP